MQCEATGSDALASDTGSTFPGCLRLLGHAWALLSPWDALLSDLAAPLHLFPLPGMFFLQRATWLTPAPHPDFSSNVTSSEKSSLTINTISADYPYHTTLIYYCLLGTNYLESP